MFAIDLYQYKTFLEPKKVACCCTLCLEGWEYCSRVLETSPGFYANTDSTTAIPIVLWQYREVNIGIKRSGVSTATPASNPWKDLFNKFITTIRLCVFLNHLTLTSFSFTMMKLQHWKCLEFTSLILVYSKILAQDMLNRCTDDDLNWSKNFC